MIGVFGGTFDPIHFGHLRPALDVYQALGLQELRFIPLNIAVHRAQPVANAAQRLAMVRAAVKGQPGFVVDERELQRSGHSYSFDTLVSLREELGSAIPLCLLTGADAFQELPAWHRPEGILNLAHIVVMRRPGSKGPAEPELGRWVETRVAADAGDLAKAPGGRVYFQEVTQLDISATAIRRLAARRLSPRFLLPDAVLEIVETEALYRGA